MFLFTDTSCCVREVRARDITSLQYSDSQRRLHNAKLSMMSTAETTLLAPSSIPGAFPVRQRILFLGNNERARVLPRYRRHRKTHRQRQTENDEDQISATSDMLRKSNAGTADEVSCVDENLPPETKPLLIVDVGNALDVSLDCPSPPGVVDRVAKLNGLPGNVAVSVEEATAEAARSTRVWMKWRKLHRGLSLKRRVTERLEATEWWRSRRLRNLSGDAAQSSTALPHRQNTLDPKSFPDKQQLTINVLSKTLEFLHSFVGSHLSLRMYS